MIDSKGGTNMKKILIQESNNQLIGSPGQINDPS